MRCFNAFFIMEGGRFLFFKILAIVFLLYLSVLLVVHFNIQNYSNTLSCSRNFQSIERMKFEKMMNYDNYSLIGIKSFFIPSPLSVLFNSIGATYDWKGRIDTIATLDIDKNAKGNAAFQEESPFSPFRYPYIILIFGGLLAMLYGFTAIRNIEFNRFLSTYWQPGQIFSGIITARTLIITFCMAILSGLILLLFYMEGIQLTAPDIKSLFYLAAVGWALLLFFFFIGIMVSHIRPIAPAWIMLLIIWASLACLLPAAVTVVVNHKAAKITDSSKVELEQLKITADFEKKAENENGEFDREKIDIGRKVIESYWNNYYKRVEKVESDLKDEVARDMEGYRDFSKWIPITFYLSVSKDIGGKGPDNYLGYYDFLITLKRNFLRFFIDRCYYNDPKEMVNFIKTNENIYYARSQIPSHFWVGLLITFLYISLFLTISFVLFKKSLFGLGKKAVAGRENADVQLWTHNVNTCFVDDEGLNDLLYSALSGHPEAARRAGFISNVWIDDTDILDETKKNDQPVNITYMPRPQDLPGDINARSLLNFVCKATQTPSEKRKWLYNFPEMKTAAKRPFKELEPSLRFQVMSQLAPLSLKKNQYYLFHDVTDGLTMEYAGQLKVLMEKLNDSGAVVIFLTASASILEIQVGKGKWFGEGGAWTYRVEAFLRAQKIMKKGKL